jgi:Raf kinase inhibitor-like YbhB/YbcL family protein
MLMHSQRDLFGVLMLVLLISGCAELGSPTSAPTPDASARGGSAMAFELQSEAFGHEQPIPTRYTCDGDDISPPIAWSDSPDGTQSFALIADDPDAPAGTWVHWVVYNLPADTRSLASGIAGDADLPAGAQHGRNGWGREEYGGPCPPRGTHRYFFKLYALDTTLNLAGASKQQLVDAMEGHILAQTELMGTYTRQ